MFLLLFGHLFEFGGHLLQAMLVQRTCKVWTAQPRPPRHDEFRCSKAGIHTPHASHAPALVPLTTKRCGVWETKQSSAIPIHNNQPPNVFPHPRCSTHESDLAATRRKCLEMTKLRQSQPTLTPMRNFTKLCDGVNACRGGFCFVNLQST